MSLSPLAASKAFRTVSVVAIYSASGPAAATRPLREAMLKSEAVGAGGVDHLGVSWSLASPATERNPRPYVIATTRHVSRVLGDAMREAV